jgi:pyruvate, orthophosphate dikinase
VVSGRRTPGHAARLETRLPTVAKQLADGVRHLELANRDVQDVEFTVETGRLYFLQTRAAKRSPRAALCIAVDMVDEGLIDRSTALARLDGVDLDRLMLTHFGDEAETAATATGAAPGVVSGRVAFDATRTQELEAAGDPVILVRRDISTDDIAGFAASAGILTAVGGRTAHAAVVARQLGKVCVVGCRALSIDEPRRRAMIGGRQLTEGEWLSIDGDSGKVSLGKRAIVTEVPAALSEVKRWRAATAVKATQAANDSNTVNDRHRPGSAGSIAAVG